MRTISLAIAWTAPGLRRELKYHGVKVVPGGRLLCDARKHELVAAVLEHNRQCQEQDLRRGP